MEKTVSLIVPVYNAERFLAPCIESLMNQTYRSVEIILVNDGSTDGSLAICKEYAKKCDRITVIDKQNEGVIKARTDGLKAAHGEYVAFVDSDDWLDDGYVSELLGELERSGAEIIVLGHYCVIAPKDGSPGLRDPESCLRDLCLFTYPTSMWAGIYPKNLLDSIPFYDDIHFFEDYLFHYILLHRVGSVCVSDYRGYHYRSNSGSINRQSINPKRMSCLKIIPMICRGGEWHDPRLERQLWFSVAHFLISNIVMLRFGADVKGLTRELKSACKRYYSDFSDSGTVPRSYRLLILLMSKSILLSTVLTSARRTLKNVRRGNTK